MAVGEIFRMFGTIGLDTSQGEKSLNDFMNRVKGAGDSIGKSFDQMGSAGGKFEAPIDKALSRMGSLGEKLDGPLTNMAVRLDQMGDSAISMGEKMQKGGTYVAAAGGVMTGVLGSMVKTTMNFDQTMSKAKALTGATEEEFASLRKKAIDLSSTSIFTGSEVAEGMANLAAAGFSVSQIQDAMSGVLDAAAASGDDFADVSKIMIATMSSFGMEAKDMGHIGDVLAAAAGSSAISIGDLGYTMEYVAPIAASAGQSLEHVAAAAAILGNAGITGGKAGTALRAALIRLAAPPKAAADALAAMGVETADAEGNMLPLADVVGQLGEAYKDLTEQERLAMTATIFGAEAASGMMTIIEAGPAELNKLTKAFEESEGAAAKMADIKTDNLAGAMNQLSSAIEAMSIAIGGTLAPYIEMAAKFITGLVNKFNSLPESTQKFIALMGGIAAITLTAGGAITIFGGLLLGQAGKIMKFLAALKQGPHTLKKFGDATRDVCLSEHICDGDRERRNKNQQRRHRDEMRRTTVGRQGEGVAQTVSRAPRQSAPRQSGNVITRAVSSLGRTAAAAGGQVANMMARGFKGASGALATAGRSAGMLLMRGFSAVASLLPMLLANPMAAMAIAVVAGIVLIGTLIYKNWDKVKEVTVNAWNTIVGAVKNALGNMFGAIRSILEAARDFTVSIFNRILGFYINVWGNIFNATRNALNNIFGAIQSVFSAISSFISSIWTRIKNTTTRIWGSIISGVSSAVGNVKSVIVNGLESAWAYIKSIPGKAWTWGKDIILGLINGIKSMKIPMPHVEFGTTEKEIMGKSVTLPTFDINWYKEGGLFNAPAIVGVGDNPYGEVALPLEPGILAGIGKGIMDNTPGGKPGNGVQIDKADFKVFVKQLADAQDVARLRSTVQTVVSDDLFGMAVRKL